MLPTLELGIGDTIFGAFLRLVSDEELVGRSRLGQL